MIVSRCKREALHGDECEEMQARGADDECEEMQARGADDEFEEVQWAVLSRFPHAIIAQGCCMSVRMQLLGEGKAQRLAS